MSLITVTATKAQDKKLPSGIPAYMSGESKIAAMASKYTATTRHRVFVKEWLKAKKMNQTKLADAMGTDKANVSRWISQPWRIDLDIISGMEVAMRLQPGDLFRHPRDVENLRRQQEALDVIRRLPTRNVS